MDRYAQMQLLMHRWLAQIGLVAPEIPSEDTKAERALLESVQSKEVKGIERERKGTVKGKY